MGKEDVVDLTAAAPAVAGRGRRAGRAAAAPAATTVGKPVASSAGDAAGPASTGTAGAGPSAGSAETAWACSTCTFINPTPAAKCDACGVAAASAAAAAADCINLESDSDEPTLRAANAGAQAVTGGAASAAALGGGGLTCALCSSSSRIYFLDACSHRVCETCLRGSLAAAVRRLPVAVAGAAAAVPLLRAPLRCPCSATLGCSHPLSRRDQVENLGRVNLARLDAAIEAAATAVFGGPRGAAGASGSVGGAGSSAADPAGAASSDHCGACGGACVRLQRSVLGGPDGSGKLIPSVSELRGLVAAAGLVPTKGTGKQLAMLLAQRLAELRPPPTVDLAAGGGGAGAADDDVGLGEEAAERAALACASEACGVWACGSCLEPIAGRAGAPAGAHACEPTLMRLRALHQALLAVASVDAQPAGDAAAGGTRGAKGGGGRGGGRGGRGGGRGGGGGSGSAAWAKGVGYGGSGGESAVRKGREAAAIKENAADARFKSAVLRLKALVAPTATGSPLGPAACALITTGASGRRAVGALLRVLRSGDSLIDCGAREGLFRSLIDLLQAIAGRFELLPFLCLRPDAADEPGAAAAAGGAGPSSGGAAASAEGTLAEALTSLSRQAAVFMRSVESGGLEVEDPDAVAALGLACELKSAHEAVAAALAAWRAAGGGAAKPEYLPGEVDESGPAAAGGRKRAAEEAAPGDGDAAAGSRKSARARRVPAGRGDAGPPADAAAASGSAAASGPSHPSGAGPSDPSGPLVVTPAARQAYLDAVGPMRFEMVDLRDSNGRYAHYYRDAIASSRDAGGEANRKRQLHIAREVSTLGGASTLPVAWESLIAVRADETRMDVLKALIIGPDGTPYEGGLFFFDILLPPTYPSAPPSVHLETTGGGRVRFNPNLYNDGKVCLSLLGTWSGPGWDPTTSTLLQVLVSIQSLILVADPYYNEPGHESSAHRPETQRASAAYSQSQRLHTLRYAILPAIKQPPAEFAGLVREHLRHKRAAIEACCDRWVAEAVPPAPPPLPAGSATASMLGMSTAALSAMQASLGPTAFAAQLAAMQAMMMGGGGTATRPMFEAAAAEVKAALKAALG